MEPSVLVETTVAEDELYADVKKQLHTWSDGSPGSEIFYASRYMCIKQICLQSIKNRNYTFITVEPVTFIQVWYKSAPEMRTSCYTGH